MAIHQSNYYQSWSQPGETRTWRANTAPAGATAQWLLVDGFWSTARNDWKLVGSRVDWLAKVIAAPAVPSALWTMLGKQQAFRNDWQLQGDIASYIAINAEPAVTPTPPPGGGESYSGGWQPRYERELELQIEREDNEIIEVLSILASRRLI